MGFWCAWMRMWMAVRCVGFSAHWQGDDFACIGFAGLPGLWRDRYEKGNGGLVDARAAEFGRGPVRWCRLCLSRTSCGVDQADLASRCRALHVDQTARTWPVRVAVCDHDRTDRVVGGTIGRVARRVRMARAGTAPQTGTRRVISLY